MSPSSDMIKCDFKYIQLDVNAFVMYMCILLPLQNLDCAVVSYTVNNPNKD